MNRNVFALFFFLIFFSALAFADSDFGILSFEIVPTRKSPCGGGTETYERWQLRIHKRLIDIESDERTLRRIMRVEIPETVHVEIELRD